MSGIVVSTDASGAVGTIRIERPEKRNALEAEQWIAFGDALRELGSSPGLRVLVVTGTGSAFAAGGDLSRFLDEIRTPRDARAFRERLAAVFDGLAGFPAPTVAKLNGPAIGGGLELSLACDIRVANDTARFGMPAVRFAMTMARSDLERLVDAVGPSTARWLTLTARVISAEEALRAGLVHAVVPASDLDGTVDQIVAGLIESDRPALEWFRRSLREIARGLPPSDDLLAEEIGSLVSPSFRERVSRFVNARKREAPQRG